MKHYHLAQINVGRILGPIDSPVMADFVAQLADINALAERSPGFVWRLKDATEVEAWDDPLMKLNMSVWESVETLREYTYKSGHVAPLRDRSKWFEKPAQAHLAMWWIPAGHVPGIEEAVERLEYRRAFGDTQAAFSFSKPFPEPEVPAGNTAAPAVSFDQRLMISQANTTNADCSPGTKFRYRQEGARVWATYFGGRVKFGSLVAIGDVDGHLDMRYHHVDARDRFRTGKCRATTEILPDGRLRLHEQWQRTNGDLCEGQSIVEEVKT